MNNIFNDKGDSHGLKEGKLIIEDLSTQSQKQMGFTAKDYMVNSEHREMYKLENNYQEQRAQVRMYAAAGSGGAATLERPVIPETEYSGGGPPGGSGGKTGGSGGGDGDDFDGKSSGDGGPNIRPMAVEEKFTLSGMFANFALNKILTGEELESHSSSIFLKISNIQIVRNILEDPKSPYKRAWDLKLRRLYFYKDKLSLLEMPDQSLTNQSDIPWNDDDNLSLTDKMNQGLSILLNDKLSRKVYVDVFVMKECGESSLNSISTVPKNATFVSYDKVIAYIKEQMEIGKNGGEKKAGSDITKTIKSVASDLSNKFGFTIKDSKDQSEDKDDKNDKNE